MTGARSHKLVTSDVSRILWYYYNDPVRVFHTILSLQLTMRAQTTLFLFCAGNEMFYVALYLMNFSTAPIGGVFDTASAYFLTQLVPALPPHLLSPKFVSAIAYLISQTTYPQLLAVLTAPVCVAKNIINMVQLWKASKILVGVDLAERAKDRETLEMREE